MTFLQLILAGCANNDYPDIPFNAEEDYTYDLGMRSFPEIVSGLENVESDNSNSDDCGSHFEWAISTPFTITYSPNTFSLFSVDYKKAECTGTFLYADRMNFSFEHEDQICTAEALSDAEDDSYNHSYLDPKCSWTDNPDEVHTLPGEATFALMLGLSIAVTQQ